MQRFWFALGVALVVCGLAVVVAPGLATGIETSSWHLPMVGLVALLAGGLAIRARLTADDSGREMPTPERKRIHPTPGDEFDRQLASLTARGRRQGVRERRAVRDRLDEVAVSVLVRDGDSETVARERLLSGTWTDDPYAVAFFAEERASDVSLEDRFRAAFSAEPNSRQRARHAIDALTQIAETERER